jgi:hypothetical protein
MPRDHFFRSRITKNYFLFLKCKTFLRNGTSVEAIDCVTDNFDILCCKITNTTGIPCNKISDCHNPQGYDPKFLPSNDDDRGTFIKKNQCRNAYACAVSVLIFNFRDLNFCECINFHSNTFPSNTQKSAIKNKIFDGKMLMENCFYNQKGFNFSKFVLESKIQKVLCNDIIILL